ncbi:LysE family translocator [Pseudomonas sp. N3-W]|jgi:threonine/homoserine/homoserine lactone efflux protein|uniref:LysE family translocator n=1 Tax=Pseudomonas fungipugnans TaxID=3024217 RepID=A0ABT6QY95_9PSED|nr:MULTISPECIES: LysE family translocator [unclassified Pseudomonas]MDI2595202.1 LysE family translocator [Pseudomonas sp. 681]UWF51485.1 LysE family translocator [Pseudomonas sp. N3-W]
MSYGFLSFLLAVLVINLSPGPAMLYVMNQSLRHGVRTGLKAAAGVEFGVFFYVLLAAFGLMLIFKEVPLLYRTVQVAGAFYLVYLAYLSWPRRKGGDGSATSDRSPEPARYAFSKGMLINLSNPKIGLFFISLLPQFVPSDASPAWLYFLIYGLIFNISGILVNMTVGLTAHSLRDAIQRSTWFDYVPPVLFAAIAVFAFIRGLA